MRFLAISNWKASVNDQSLMLRWVRIELLLFALQKEQSFRQAYHNRWCTKFCEVLWGLRATDTFFFQCLSNQDKKTFVMHFAVTSFQKLKEEDQWEEIFVARIIFSDETAFQLSGYVNRHNNRVWESTIFLQRLKIQETVPCYSVLFLCLNKRFRVLSFLQTVLWTAQYAVVWRRKC